MARANGFRLAAAFLIAATASMAGVATAVAAGGPAFPGASYDPAGVTGPPAQPSTEFRYVALFAGARGTVVAAIDTDDGVVRESRWLRGPWALPAVTLKGDPGGLSADGGTLVLVRPTYSLRPRTTRFLIIRTSRGTPPPPGRRQNAGLPRLRITERLTLDGAYSFDAISPDGRLLYLIEYEHPRNPFDYRVRAYDLAAGEFRPGRIVDPSEPDEQMTGQPVARATSPDGRWAYTLYGGGEETFIHALDTEGATAVCVDLHQFDQGNFFRLGLDVDPATGAITVLKRGAPAASVDPQTFDVGPAPSADTEGTADDEGGFPWTAALAVLAGALALGGAAVVRRRRRRRLPAAELPLDPLAGSNGAADESSEIKAPAARGAGEPG